ncbi:CBS domain-containing protein [Kitasatospora terrestris]
MTREVVTVTPTTGFREVLERLTEYDITAVPVVDRDGRPLGVVSEADLLRTQARQEDPSGLLPPAAGGPAGATAGELMTSPAVCTTEGASVVAAARLMARRQVKRLPVVGGDGRLVGVVSRGDLLRVFLRDDVAIRHEIIEDVLGELEGVSPAEVSVETDQGRVVLSGTVGSAQAAAVLVRLCGAVDGVVSVTDRTLRTAPQSLKV